MRSVLKSPTLIAAPLNDNKIGDTIEREVKGKANARSDRPMIIATNPPLQQRPLSVDEFLSRYRDDNQYELIDGEVFDLEPTGAGGVMCIFKFIWYDDFRRNHLAIRY